MKLLTTLIVVVYIALIAQARPSLNDWTEFKQKHGKEYLDVHEDSMRMNIFIKNKKLVDEFNKEQSANAGFTMGLNHLSDWTDAEFEEINGYRLRKDFDSSMVNSPEAQKFIDSILNDNSKDVPDSFDWRKFPNRVTPVKNQGHCGSCWAFSATGVLEGQQIVRNLSSLISLSEQNIIDCDVDDSGCGGGNPMLAFNFVWDENGIEDNENYPYQANDQDCRFNKSKVVFTDKGGSYLPTENEVVLKEVVAKYGPVSVGIDVIDGFKEYSSGVYKSDSCGSQPQNLNHAVLVVGYGVDPKEGDYWLIKNSWGSGWGEEGYVRMARNRNNMCGIATEATIAAF